MTKGMKRRMITSIAYERIYREYSPIVFSYISARVPSREDAKDLCHNVFVKLLRALETFDESKASVSTFLYTLAHNTVVDYYRTAHPYSEISEYDAVLPSAEDVVMDRSRLLEISDAISRLPQQQRDILILRFYRGWTLVKIAQEMGLTYNTVCSRQKSAFESLRRMLAESRNKESGPTGG